LILTVTPNAAVDKTYRIEDFTLDKVNRPSQTTTVAGGKGINVARVYQIFGGKAVATGFLGGINGRIVARALAAEQIESDFIHVRGETRICIAVIDPLNGSQTEINEQGPEISRYAVRELLRRVERLLSQQAYEFVVLSGSLPPCAPLNLYCDLLAIAKRAGVPGVLDTSGLALREAVQCQPWMLKPNIAELETLLGTKLDDFDKAVDAAKSLLHGGTEIVALSLGAEGAVVVSRSGIWRAVPPKIDFASAVASGDSFVAAFLWAWSHGSSPASVECALRLACGAGAANAAVIGAGLFERSSAEWLAEGTSIAPVAFSK